jgi:lipopolysaccharide export system protein LptA
MRKTFLIPPHHHPREGGDPARAKRLYKGRLTATDQPPAFAGVALVLVALMLVTNAHAETPTPAPQPVTISAVKSLEWDRKAKTYTARQDVVATQGAANIHSDILVAHYDEGNGGKSDITTMDADGHVTINSAPYTAYGDHAVYNVKTGNAILTGKDLKIISTDSVLTAKDSIEFNSKENRMTAVGGPKAVKGDDILTADTMSAYFNKDDAGKMAADKITAKGHVVITTPTETATGDEGIYDVPTQKAVLTGKVRILQDKNWLEGTRADVDMVTGISRLSGEGNATTEGRVTGTFYPQSKDDKPKDDKPKDQQPPQGQAPPDHSGDQKN